MMNKKKGGQQRTSLKRINLEKSPSAIDTTEKLNQPAVNANSKNQMDLFAWRDENFPQKEKTKTQLCLDCGVNELTLKFNEQKGIYEGNRICSVCKTTQKRRFL